MLELLKEMDDDTYERMIAAYAIGITIAETGPHIVPAKGADDTGVTICYNSVRDTGCTMRGWEKSSVAINPVNWRTDSTRASLITEPSPLLPVAEQKKDTMTVHLDTATGLLIVEGFTAQDYMLPLLGVEGNYHTREIWLYRNQLRENMALRGSRKTDGIKCNHTGATNQKRDLFYSSIRSKVINSIPLDIDEEVFGYIVKQQLERERKSEVSLRMAD